MSVRHFEDFAVGEEIRTQGRTITETDAVMWAMFTGDFNPMHVDEELASREGLYERRFPPGLMAVAIASGLKERLGLFTGTGLAIKEQTVRYRRPVTIGDTIRVVLTVDDLRRSRNGSRGTVVFRYDVVREDDEVCAEGEWTMVVAARGQASPSSRE